VSRTPYIYAAAALVATLVGPASASAQWRYPGYPAYRYAAAESDLRFSIKPKEASVYVDGYFAGKVDEFDGTFQRLHVAPGEHEIVVYLPGHHSLKRRLYLSPNATRKIEGTLEPLAPGDPQEAEPVPSEPRDDDERYERQPRRGPLPGRRTQGPMDRDRDRDRDRDPMRPPPVASQPSRFGSLSIRVQPGDATLLIDGERWPGPGGDDRLIVQVTPGRHKIEAEKDGYMRFVTEIEATRDQTTAVNISMTKSK
jgi:hypothetical protein